MDTELDFAHLRWMDLWEDILEVRFTLELKLIGSFEGSLKQWRSLFLDLDT